tara:strand:- start:110 stop:226 length:117 start_codon:yes stop_codon:yes gene_type:complete
MEHKNYVFHIGEFFSGIEQPKEKCVERGKKEKEERDFR